MNPLASRFRPFGIKKLELVTLTVASWNQIEDWLSRTVRFGLERTDLLDTSWWRVAL
jgi:hypothetical protein